MAQRTTSVDPYPVQELFQGSADTPILGKKDIVDLYQSRTATLVFLECIELLPVSCSFGKQDPISEDIAFHLYGANDAITLLETVSGCVFHLDGYRCYPRWKQGVDQKRVHEASVFNVITATRSFSDLELLQIATFCDIQSRRTRMSALFAKLFVTHAFLFALQPYLLSCGIDVTVTIKDNELGHITEHICHLLYNTSLFDSYLSMSMTKGEAISAEKFVRKNIRTCVAISGEYEIAHSCQYLHTKSPIAADKYFREQFFHDYLSEWFTASPQLLLLFLLPSFPYLNASGESNFERESYKARDHIRSRIPGVCKVVTPYFGNYLFAEIGLKTAYAFLRSCLIQKKNEKTSIISLVAISSKIKRAIQDVEQEFILTGHYPTIGGSLTKFLTIEGAKVIRKHF